MANKPRAKKLAVGMVALCDYATKSEGSKHTLVNIYSGDVIVGAFPAQMHFGFYAEVVPGEIAPEKAILTLLLNRKKFAGMEIGFANARPNRPAVILIPALGFDVESPVTMEFVLDVDGYSTTQLLKKEVRLAETSDSATAWRPPA